MREIAGAPGRTFGMPGPMQHFTPGPLPGSLPTHEFAGQASMVEHTGGIPPGMLEHWGLPVGSPRKIPEAIRDVIAG